jgi:uncharacterized repeat protein (TIGR02543 family)
MNRKTIYAGGVVSLLLLFAACEMAGQKPGLFSGAEGKAAVHIRIDGADMRSRTVVPDAALDDVTKWELWGAKEADAETLHGEFPRAEDAAIFLDPGTWHFTLKGYKDSALILSGSLEGQSIILDGPNNLFFTVAPVLEGGGTIRLVIELPAGSGITAALVFKDGTPEGGAVTPDGDRIVVEGGYPAGDYYFSIRLYKGETLYGVVSEIAEVRANLQSEKTYPLTWQDLNATYVITYHMWDEETEPGYYQSTDSDKTLTDYTLRPGYNFLGWYDNPGLDGDVVTVIPAGSTGDKDLYAKWSLITYYITYNTHGGTYTGENPGTYTIESLPITLTAPTREGYTFGGWYAAGDFSGGQVTGIPAGSTGNKNFYAKWNPITYSITYNTNGGTYTGENPGTYTIESLPVTLNAPAREGYTFGGWYAAGDFSGEPVTEIPRGSTGNKNFYARWDQAGPEIVPADSLVESLEWIRDNAEEGGAYKIILNKNEAISPQELSYEGKNVSITLINDTTEWTVSLSENGTLFTVGSGVTLILDKNVTLQGRDNNAPLVKVNGEGTLVMNNGAKVTGNYFSSFYYGNNGGGGVHVSGGTFTMYGGTISGNSLSINSGGGGGGVCVSDGGTFTMSGGIISGNFANFNGGYGGGVYVNGGTFTKESGGIIYGSNESEELKNTAHNMSAVYVSWERQRLSTAGIDVILDSSKTGGLGGWELNDNMSLPPDD